MKQLWQFGLLAGLLAAVVATQAQQASDPLTAALKRQFDTIALNLKEAAETMPVEKYSFKPSPDVKTFGQEIGHGANFQYTFCARATGGSNPNKEDFEKVGLPKAALIKALTASNEYCAGILNAANDKWMLEMVGEGTAAQPRAAILAQNNSHSNETYGTIVPYLRMSGIVPPSTARAQRRSQ